MIRGAAKDTDASAEGQRQATGGGANSSSLLKKRNRPNGRDNFVYQGGLSYMYNAEAEEEDSAAGQDLQSAADATSYN